MKKTVILFNDYKDFLKSYILENQSRRGLISELADVCGCQRSYFSQVIHSEIHLTPDHAFALADALHMTSLEKQYFCLLVDLARCGTQKLRKHINQQLQRIKEESENLSQRVGKKKIEPGIREQLYYSSWLYSAVHVLTSVPEFQSTQSIAKHLGIRESNIEEILQDLEFHQFVVNKGNRWVIYEGDLHLSKDSLFNSVNHLNWRLQAVENSKTKNTTGVHYTSVASLSKNDFELLKAEILQFIDRSQKIISHSKEEKIAVMTIDWFDFE